MAPLPRQASTLSPTPSPWHELAKYGTVLSVLVTLWLTDTLANLVKNLVAYSLGQQLPIGSFGWFILLVAGSLDSLLLANLVRRKADH